MLKAGGADPGHRLSFVAADLEDDAGWPEAAGGCEYVLHLASPLPANVPKHEDELIVPARRRAPRAACRARRRSQACGADLFIRGDRLWPRAAENAVHRDGLDRSQWSAAPPLTSNRRRWANARPGISSPGKAVPSSFSVVNPVGVFGPALGPDYSSSILLVKRMMDGAMPGLPKLYFGVVDVRDVADLHNRAMSHPTAKGERFLGAAGDFMSMLDIAKVLDRRMGASAKLSADPAIAQLAGAHRRDP